MLDWLKTINPRALWRQRAAAPTDAKPQRRAQKRGGSRQALNDAELMTSRLSPSKWVELLELTQLRDVLSYMPSNFAEGTVLHALFQGAPLLGNLREHQAGKIIIAYLGEKAEPVAGADVLSIHCNTACLPVSDACCNWALVSAPVLPLGGTGMPGLIRELGRILMSGGGAALLDWHPYGTGLIHSKSQEPSETLGFEPYFEAFTQAGLSVTQLREAFVDVRIRPLMETEEEKLWYNEHRREPWAVSFFVRKL